MIVSLREPEVLFGSRLSLPRTSRFSAPAASGAFCGRDWAGMSENALTRATLDSTECRYHARPPAAPPSSTTRTSRQISRILGHRRRRRCAGTAVGGGPGGSSTTFAAFVKVARSGMPR
jgi:hypothetical protein